MNNLFVDVEAHRKGAHPAKREVAIVRGGGAPQREHLQVTSLVCSYFLYSKDPSEMRDP